MTTWVTGDRVLFKKELGTIGVCGAQCWFQADSTKEPVRVDAYYLQRPPLTSGMRVRWGGERDKATKKFPEGVVTVAEADGNQAEKPFRVQITAVRWDGKDDFTPPLNPDQVALLMPVGVFDTATVDAVVTALSLFDTDRIGADLPVIYERRLAWGLLRGYLGIYVEPAYRRQGLGEALVREFVRVHGKGLLFSTRDPSAERMFRKHLGE